jgi:F0F1-type ATP synthase membrane subunit b/b'
MNDTEAQKQIQQMCAFIDQEAKEKVAEIRLKTEQERDKQLSLLSVQGRQSIKDQYDQMVKDLNVKKRMYARPPAMVILMFL